MNKAESLDFNEIDLFLKNSFQYSTDILKRQISTVNSFQKSGHNQNITRIKIRYSNFVLQ